MKTWWIFLAFLLVVPVNASCDNSPSATRSGPIASFGVVPTLTIPSPADPLAGSLTLGGTAALVSDFYLPFLPQLYASACLDYGFLPLATSGTVSGGIAESVSLLSASAGLGAQLSLTDWMALRLFASGGYYFGFLNSQGFSQGTGNGFVSAGLGARFTPWSPFAIGLDVSYRLDVSLLQQITVGLGLIYNLEAPGSAAGQGARPAPKPRPLENAQQTAGGEKGLEPTLGTVELDSIFPVFHTYYDDHPVGRLSLRNGNATPLKDVLVSLYVRQFMDAPKECATIALLQPNEERVVDLYALFNNSILEVTEGTKAAAEITVTYSSGGTKSSVTKSETIRIYHRNAMTWDDNRKAAAFVTAKDPAVVFFSNNINVMVKDRLNQAVDQNLQMAIAFHDALRAYGIAYVSNPLTPYATVSKDKLAVDTLKFPRQTFENRSGDCSDLSLLYCAVLESVQIETAFITIPGHIFMALALKSTPDEARAAYSHIDELIVSGGKVWVPVEVTERTGNFLAAWQEGASEWRENSAKGLAGFYPVHDAWKIYEPVGLPGSSLQPPLPDASKVLPDFEGDVSRYIEREIYAKAAELQGEIARSKESPKAVNALGVLYARYDLRDKARVQFESIVARQEYVPALVNLGNLAFRASDMKTALSYYQRASARSAENPGVLLGLARVNQALENFGSVKEYYDELKKVSPRLAQQFAYLELKGEESTRAAEISGAKELIIWDEE